MIRATTKHQAVQKQRCERNSLFYLLLEKHQRNKLLSLLLQLPAAHRAAGQGVCKHGFSCTGQLPSQVQYNHTTTITAEFELMQNPKAFG